VEPRQPSGWPRLRPGSPPDIVDADASPAGRLAVPGPGLRRAGPLTRMVPGEVRRGDRLLRFAVSGDPGVGLRQRGADPIWAVNLHGYFAGGGMYWRESARLAAELGWRVVNPSLPGFGGSDPLRWDEVSLHALSEDVAAVMDHVGAGPAVILGHSMGGAVAVQYALDHPERTLGVVYRDGVGTPAWRARHGIVPAVLSRISPGIGVFADLALSVAADVPDLFVGRMYSTVRSVLPETRMNLRSLEGSLPVGNMLMAIDQRAEIGALAERGDIPILPIWGVLDRISPTPCAEEFASLTATQIQWVPGGHSWMLARPTGQASVLRYLTSGMDFVARVTERAARLAAERASVGWTPANEAVPPLELSS